MARRVPSSPSGTGQSPAQLQESERSARSGRCSSEAVLLSFSLSLARACSLSELERSLFREQSRSPDRRALKKRS